MGAMELIGVEAASPLLAEVRAQYGAAFDAAIARNVAGADRGRRGADHAGDRAEVLLAVGVATLIGVEVGGDVSGLPLSKFSRVGELNL